MKKARVTLVGMFLLFLMGFLLCGPKMDAVAQSNLPVRANTIITGSNMLWLQLASFTNNTASFVIYTPFGATNNVYNVCLTTNLQPPLIWSRIARCTGGQTNAVATNLPPNAGYFALCSSIRPGFDQSNLPANDDGSTGLIPLPFTINFLSNSESALYVNNNGNVTFDKPLSTYSPVNLAAAGVKIIAPFWADVDTRNPASSIVTFGTNVVNGRMAFGVNYVNVGYYAYHADRLLSCQALIIDRSDTGAGNFDLELNYDRAEWQWGDVSVGSPPRVGYSDGTLDWELPGSGVNGVFMDTNTATGLIYTNLNSNTLGRYRLNFRNGQSLQ